MTFASGGDLPPLVRGRVAQSEIQHFGDLRLDLGTHRHFTTATIMSYMPLCTSSLRQGSAAIVSHQGLLALSRVPLSRNLNQR